MKTHIIDLPWAQAYRLREYLDSEFDIDKLVLMPSGLHGDRGTLAIHIKEDNDTPS